MSATLFLYSNCTITQTLYRLNKTCCLALLTLSYCVLSGCASAKLNSADLAKVLGGELAVIETDNVYSGFHLVFDGVAQKLGDNSSLTLDLVAIDGVEFKNRIISLYANEIVAVKPGMHKIEVSCDYTSSDGENRYYGKETLDIDAKPGFAYFILTHSQYDSECGFMVHEYHYQTGHPELSARQ